MNNCIRWFWAIGFAGILSVCATQKTMAGPISTGGKRVCFAGEEEERMALELTELVNQERAGVGSNPLELDELLSEAAEQRAEEAAVFFSHTRPDGRSCFSALTDLKVTYTSCGENIASGQTSAGQVMEEWMASPGHQENILRGMFDKIGVGCYTDKNIIYWVQLFTGNH